jgi:hypothetical protein
MIHQPIPIFQSKEEKVSDFCLPGSRRRGAGCWQILAVFAGRLHRVVSGRRSIAQRQTFGRAQHVRRTVYKEIKVD